MKEEKYIKCPTGKVKFREHKFALDKIEILNRTKKNNNVTRCYKCPKCEYWHLAKKRIKT